MKLYLWYKLTWLKPNSDKYHLLLSTHDKSLELTVYNDKVEDSSEENLLGVTFDNDFSCVAHVKNMCKKANKKLHALYRFCKYITLNQGRIIIKAFIASQFGYCPLMDISWK